MKFNGMKKGYKVKLNYMLYMQLFPVFKKTSQLQRSVDEKGHCLF